MGLRNLILILLIAGIGLWVLGQLPGIDDTIKKIIKVVVIAVVVVYAVFFVLALLPIPDLQLPRGR